MNRGRWNALKGASFVSLLALPLPIVIAASCADSESSQAESPDAALVGSSDAGSDAATDVADVGCEGAEADCALTCEQAPWCPATMTLSPFAALTAVWGSGKNDVWAVGSNATVVHWDGATWKSIPIEGKNTFNTVWGSGPNDVWIASATDSVFRSLGWQGAEAKFERVPMPLSAETDVPIFRIWGTSTDDMYLAGEAFEMLVGEDEFVTGNLLKKRNADGGVAWEPAAGEATVLAMWGAAAGDLWVAADQSADAPWKVGLTFHGVVDADAGAFTWTNVDSRSLAPLRALWGSSASDLWAVGDVGTIRHLTSAVASEWQIIPSPTRESLYGLWGSAADDVWAVGARGTILHYDGQVWTETAAAFPAGAKPNLYGVWGSARDDVWIVGDGIVLHYDGRTFGDAGGGK